MILENEKIEELCKEAGFLTGALKLLATFGLASGLGSYGKGVYDKYYNYPGKYDNVDRVGRSNRVINEPTQTFNPNMYEERYNEAQELKRREEEMLKNRNSLTRIAKGMPLTTTKTETVSPRQQIIESLRDKNVEMESRRANIGAPDLSSTLPPVNIKGLEHLNEHLYK